MSEEFDFEELAPWLALLLTLVGGLLRILFLAKQGLWLDETFSVWLANQSLPDMLHWIVTIDKHPPLYYLLLHAWIPNAEDIPYHARLLSVLFGTGTIPVIYLTGKRLSGTLMGLVAATFLAFSPFNIYFAQEARMYTLLAFNAALAIYALVRLLTDERSRMPIGSQFRGYLHAWRTAGPAEPDPAEGFRYKIEPPKRGLRAWIYRHRWSPIRTIETDLAWVALIVFSTATLYTHNAAIFFLIATNLFVFSLLLIQKRHNAAAQPAFQAPSLASWIKAQLSILILWSPWIVVFIRQAGRVDQAFWIPKPTWDIIYQTFRSLLNTSAPNASSPPIMMWILCAVLCLGLVYYRKKLSRFFFLAALFAVPFLGELLVSLRRPVFLDRTLIWITVPLVLLLAAGILQLRFRLLMVIVVGVIATNYLFTTTDYYRWYQKENWDTAASFVGYFAEKDDLILFNSNFVVIPFDYYFKTYADYYSLQVEKRGVPLDLFQDASMEPKMTPDDVPGLIALISGHDRVWLVYSHNSYTDPMGLIPQTLASQMHLSRERQFYGGIVQLYVNP